MANNLRGNREAMEPEVICG